MVEVILRDDHVQGRQVPAVEDVFLVLADDGLVGIDGHQVLSAIPRDAG
jgi:hypothetical protein